MHIHHLPLTSPSKITIRSIATAAAATPSRLKTRPPHPTLRSRCDPTTHKRAHLVANFSTCPTYHKSKDKNQLPPRPTLPDSDLKHSYLKGSGPGGQKINKTSSAVQLTHLPTGLVVKSQATRSRTQNHTIAKRILAEKIEFLEKGEESRVAKKGERARQKKAGRLKKTRRKYRKLAGEGDKVGVVGDVEGGDEDGEEGEGENRGGVIEAEGEGEMAGEDEVVGGEVRSDVLITVGGRDVGGDVKNNAKS